MKNVRLSGISCLFALSLLTSAVFSVVAPHAQASIGLYKDQSVEIKRLVKKTRSKYAYAGKLSWSSERRRWQKVILVYNNAEDPEPNHPVWRYVKALKTPVYYGRYNQDLHFKPFYLTSNCSGRTPLSIGRPWVINFDRLTNGLYSKADLSKDWNCPRRNLGNTLVNVVDGDRAYSGSALRIHYPKGKSGCYTSKQCVDWKPQLGGKFKKLYYGFRVKFPEDFDFVKGGKLPGLAGGDANTGGSIPNGTDGWSVRVMWNKEGKLVQSVYHPDQPSKYGDIFKWEMEQPIEKGKWHTIQTLVYLNDPEKKDGVVKTWLNGEQVLDKTDLRFRSHANLKIDRFMFTSFFGGNGPYWAPGDDQYAYIDDVVLSLKPPFYP